LFVPTTFGNLLALEMESRYPVDIFLFPLFLALFLDIDDIQLESSLYVI
jgi:hypothetical protein